MFPAGRVHFLLREAFVKDPHGQPVLLLWGVCWVLVSPHKSVPWEWKGRPPSHVYGHPFLCSAHPSGSRCHLLPRGTHAHMLERMCQHLGLKGRRWGDPAIGNPCQWRQRPLVEREEIPNSSSAPTPSAPSIRVSHRRCPTACCTVHTETQNYGSSVQREERLAQVHTAVSGSQHCHCPSSQTPDLLTVRCQDGDHIPKGLCKGLYQLRF